MSSDHRVAPSADPSSDGGAQQDPGGLHRWMKALFELTPWGLRRRAELQSADIQRLQAGFDRVEHRLDTAEDALRTVQSELSKLRDSIEARLDADEKALASVTGETARIRDDVVPALVGRSDALFERFAAELDEVGSLVERMLRDEPLPLPGEGPIDEARLAAAMATVQPALLEAFRGPEAEIAHRLDHYLEALKGSSPVLDLGCGRGELLLMLREAGIDASGIEGDAAVAQTAERRGLVVSQGDVLEVLRTVPEASRGAVTAIHLFEHLAPPVLLAVLAEVHRVLRPGGLLIIESPNPHSLRVGAALYWVDPTHLRPLMPETMELYLTTSGFAVDRRELLHPFPADQMLADGGDRTVAEAATETEMLATRLDRLQNRLDELVNGPRDFAVWARKPNQTTT